MTEKNYFLRVGWLDLEKAKLFGSSGMSGRAAGWASPNC